MSTLPPPGWYPDPHGRHEQRWWDGQAWSAHVAGGGFQGIDDVVVPGTDSVDRVQRQVQRQARVDGTAQGGGTIWSEPVLVVNQRARLIEVTNSYAVYDQHGTQIGSVQQVGQSTARKVLRVLTDVDQFLTTTLQVSDMAGNPQLVLTRPGKILRSTVIVQTPAGHEVGRLVQRNVFGRIRFGMESGGGEVGSLNAENWRAWNFSIQDPSGTEVARITKTWEGIAKALFTTADNYVVQIHRPLQDPLRSLVIAAALTVDTALKQDAKG